MWPPWAGGDKAEIAPPTQAATYAPLQNKVPTYPSRVSPTPASPEPRIPQLPEAARLHGRSGCAAPRPPGGARPLLFKRAWPCQSSLRTSRPPCGSRRGAAPRSSRPRAAALPPPSTTRSRARRRCARLRPAAHRRRATPSAVAVVPAIDRQIGATSGRGSATGAHGDPSPSRHLDLAHGAGAHGGPPLELQPPPAVLQPACSTTRCGSLWSRGRRKSTPGSGRAR